MAAALGGLALVAAEVWIADKIVTHVTKLPQPFQDGAMLGLGHLVVVILELATVIAAASALAVALSVIERSEADPWWSSCPIPAGHRALQCWWRVASSLTWVIALAVPPACVLSPAVRADPWGAIHFVAGGFLLLATASAVGCTLAMVLATIVPRRVLVPISWSTTTAAIVAAVVWLRRLHPEDLATTDDPVKLVEWLSRTGNLIRHTGPLARLADSAGAGESLLPAATSAVASLGILVVVFLFCAPRARRNLTTESSRRPLFPWFWRPLDSLLTRGPLGTFVASRLRLTFRDVSQGGQTLYVLGLGVVYVENLRALPLSEPLAVELAGLINLTMSALLVLALGLRFAYPARLLEGVSHWWWSTAPISRLGSDAVMALVAALPSLVLAGALFGASILVTGSSHASQQGWWIIPWLALWMSLLGLAIGPPLASPHHTSWLDAALGGGGLSYLAMGVGGAGLCIVSAGRRIIATLAEELGTQWNPGFWLGQPKLIAVLLTALVATMYAVRLRRRDG